MATRKFRIRLTELRAMHGQLGRLLDDAEASVTESESTENANAAGDEMDPRGEPSGRDAALPRGATRMSDEAFPGYDRLWKPRR